MFAGLADGVAEPAPWRWWVIGFGGLLVSASRFRGRWIDRLDPVVVLGQLAGAVICARELALIRQARAGAPG